MRAVHITQHDIRLRPEVLKALQDIKESLMPTNYEPMGHFKGFFMRYGTHLSNGVLTFRGMLKSVAYCKGFPESERPNMEAVVTEASEKAIYLSFSNDIPMEAPINAYEVLGKT